MHRGCAPATGGWGCRTAQIAGIMQGARASAGCASIGRVRKHRQGAQASAGCASIGRVRDDRQGAQPSVGRTSPRGGFACCARMGIAQGGDPPNTPLPEIVFTRVVSGVRSQPQPSAGAGASASPQEQAQVRQAHTADGTQHPRTTTHPRDLGLRGGCVVWTPDRAERPHRAARGRASRRR